ncbi:murein hydrolase activator EnvC family protein [Mesonia ostreae]|uniref:Peptidoglycan DD-metalloendopeptidase family protein n=1 Tax=Mesonia ostreae TaxID=861110 RepID=A0ABU2KIU6_9FLAO|nr:peptidoglycan DD-metalloendopeptidase family protein [Mesonia ostreae]MDT0294612.1 peptidoglycan DD-metalloendopeptidase family protein [Mesonia ostreae]
MMRKRTYILSILFVCFCFLQGFSQSKERKELEKRRLDLKEEIKKINSLLTVNKKKKQSVLVQVEDLDKRINATQNLIKVTNQQANLLTREVNENLDKITKLRKDLEALKEDYAKMIRKSYQSSSNQSRIMFLFSSENFLQAYKRLQYMKQYANYRKQQGDKIKEQAQLLQDLNAELIEQRKTKENLLAENRVTQKKLKEDKKQQQVLMASIQEKEGTFESQLKVRQRQISRIDDQIEKLIREAIAAENKKKGNTSTSAFKLTPEAKALAADFTSNKGKLPWPVKSGVISMRFGVHPHKTVPSVKVKSIGVRIETNTKEPVKAIFKGEVMKIQAIKGANKAVMVRHGNYISVYNNLETVNVQTGDQISTGQILGRVGNATSTGRPTLSLSLFEDTTLLDPALWIYKM